VFFQYHPHVSNESVTSTHQQWRVTLPQLCRQCHQGPTDIHKTIYLL